RSVCSDERSVLCRTMGTPLAFLPGVRRSRPQQKEQSMYKDRKGFTLIELLIVVVIIGILAAIAIPKFSNTREKAYISAMKSDLKNLMSQQEIYYSNYYTYTTDETALG